MRSFVVIDLKIGDFEPEFAGKMNFYLNAVDAHLRHATDAPSIGLILCRSHSATVAEYALRGVDKPLAVAEYRLGTPLPGPLADHLPSLEALEQVLSSEVDATWSDSDGAEPQA